MAQLNEASGDEPSSSIAADPPPIIGSDKSEIEKKPEITSSPAKGDRDTPAPTTAGNSEGDSQIYINLIDQLNSVKSEKKACEQEIASLKAKLETTNNELEREVQRRCDLEQKFSEEAKRSTDQIEELIAKSDQDDASISELRKRFDLYSSETASMMESFTTNREILTSQILELRQENDYLLGKYIGKSRDLQNSEINLPQTVEELQFHCLTLNEKLILATQAKERLETTLMQNSKTNS